MASKKRKSPPKPYDSWFEFRLHQKPLANWNHHPPRLQYSIPREYEADFIREVNGKTLLIESKGYFRTSEEANKYLHIKKSLPDDHELIFILENEKVPLHFRGKRKDGTKMSISEYLDKNGIRWFSEYEIPEQWK